MNCCTDCSPEYNKEFNRKKAVKELASYKKNGAEKSTKILINTILQQQKGNLEGRSLLDIGGGIGIIGLELAKKGLRSATNIDISSDYLLIAREEAEKHGLKDQFSFINGDAVKKLAEMDRADLVTLDKSICCYDDFASLVNVSIKKTNLIYGIIIPRDVWWVKAVNALGNLFRKIKRNSFRTFIHPVSQIRDIILENGFEEVRSETVREWSIMIYRSN